MVPALSLRAARKSMSVRKSTTFVLKTSSERRTAGCGVSPGEMRSAPKARKVP